jgi:hypothetical protein
MTIDSRAHSVEKIEPPAPLPHVSRRALLRVADPIAIPTVCRYCSGAVDLVENSVIYNGRTFGDWPYAYLCSCCRAYVGLHPQTDLPLGTLADKRTRDARNATKKTFETIFRDGHMSRKQAYAWLAGKMVISTADCHFGLFEPAQCKIAEAFSMEYLANPNAKIVEPVAPGKLAMLVRRFK